jgi:hypothetical protein
LVPRPSERRALLPRHLEFDQPKRKPVDERQYVWTAGLVVLLHAHLVDDDEVVALGLIEVEQPCKLMAQLARLVPDLDRHALGQKPMQTPVFGQYVGALGTTHRSDDLINGLGREPRVQPGKRRTQPTL